MTVGRANDPDYVTQQEEEVEALKAIFASDFEDLRGRDVWHVRRPPEVKIKLKPAVGGETATAYVGVTLHVICPERYPDEWPELEILDTHGLSNAAIEDLKQDLIEARKESVGDVMIHALALRVEDFLLEHNQCPKGSFYDEMMSSKAAGEAAKAKSELDREKRSKEQERQFALEERARKQEALKLEAQLRRSERATRTSSESRFSIHESSSDPSLALKKPSSETHVTPSVVHAPSFSFQFNKTFSKYGARMIHRSRSFSASSYGEPCGVPGHDGVGIVELVKFGRRFQRGQCVGHKFGRAHFVGLDLETGEPGSMTLWEINCDEKDANVAKLVQGLENEITYLTRLRCDRIISVIGADIAFEHGLVRILTVQAFSPGTSASWHIERRMGAEYGQLRQYAVGVLEALRYLHENNVIHRDLRDSHIHVDSSGYVKLSGFAIEWRVRELEDAFTGLPNSSEDDAGGAFALERSYPAYSGRSGKKADIHRFGIVMLSLRGGKIVEATYPVIPKDLSPDFKNFVENCLRKDEKNRWTAEELLEHQFLAPSSAMPSMIFPSRISKTDSVGRQESSAVEESSRRPFALPETRGASRLTTEFHVIGFVGSGGFGQVIKARNRLDGNLYAIKRIKLNPKTNQLNRKILREVQLLSKLSHENVVRYFNSWTETISVQRKSSKAALDEPDGNTGYFQDASEEEDSDEDDEDEDSSTESTSDKAGQLKLTGALVLNGEASKRKSKWFGSSSGDEADFEEDEDDDGEEDDEAEEERDSDEDDDDDDEDSSDYFGQRRSVLRALKDDDASDSAGIVFEAESTSGKGDDEEKKVSTLEKPALAPKMEKYMYIQMEYCDKSTLRHAIDENLYADMVRVWRLFRQIIEGLAHIHQQGMIHRDLKPVNIFLDSEDNVKIGDFGLATVNAVSQIGVPLMDLETTLMSLASDGGTTTDSDRHTTQIGTFLYVAPEIVAVKQTHGATYDQKVDIYSLGIIFFEMCSPPLATGMERVKVLTDLRSEDVIIPDAFLTSCTPAQIQLLKRLLSHNPQERPTSTELLQSGLLPPPHVEESKMRDMVALALNNPSSKTYKDVISLCFEQQMTDMARSTAVTFELDEPRWLSRGGTVMMNYLTVKESVRDLMADVFRCHGAVAMSTTLLDPRMDPELLPEHPNSVPLMDHAGTIVHLPYDLRRSFVRHLVRHDLTQVKRYAVGKVFRKHKVFGLHPRELEEGDFDILTPSGNLLADAEVIFATYQVLSSFSWLLNNKEYQCSVELNHTSLLLSVLTKHGIREDKHADILGAISECREQTRQEFIDKLVSQGLSDQAAESLWTAMKQVDGQKLDGMLKSLGLGSHKRAISLAKSAITELKTIIAYAEAFGVKFPISVAPTMVANLKDYSGMMCHFVCQRLGRKRNRSGEGSAAVFAAGGRYSALIGRMRRSFEAVKGPTDQILQEGVGISISVDKLISFAPKTWETTGKLSESQFPQHNVRAGADAVICHVGRRWDGVEMKKIAEATELWKLGGRVDILYDSCKDLEALQQLCVQRGIPIVIALKRDEVTLLVWRVLSNGPRFVERKVPKDGHAADMTKDVVNREIPKDKSSGKGDEGCSGDHAAHPGATDKPRAESTTRDSKPSGDQSSKNKEKPVTLTFCFGPDNSKKPKSYVKKNAEAQIWTILTPILNGLKPDTGVRIIAVDLPKVVIQALAVHVDFCRLDDSTAQDFLAAVVEKHHRHRSILSEIMDTLLACRDRDRPTYAIVYSVADKYYRVFM